MISPRVPRGDVVGAVGLRGCGGNAVHRQIELRGTHAEVTSDRHTRLQAQEIVVVVYSSGLSGKAPALAVSQPLRGPYTYQARDPIRAARPTSTRVRLSALTLTDVDVLSAGVDSAAVVVGVVVGVMEVTTATDTPSAASS
eukprot:765894-Hanusia_phi.AAC.2